MVRIGRRVGEIACTATFFLAAALSAANAVTLDKDGTIKLGLRTYVNARVGTENTHNGVPLKVPSGGTIASSATFPESKAGRLRQNRFFMEAEFNHELDPLVKRGFGPLSLLNDLPFKIKNLAYHLTFRGEGDGLYDWGPREYSTAREFRKLAAADLPNPLVSHQAQAFIDVAATRRKLRHLGVDRERLFQAYFEGNAGKLFFRLGRQILSWGETDGFQLLDNINPLDNSFGGFLISLDERRVPLDMARGQYYLGNIGPLSEAFLEAYVAIDNRVGLLPGIPAGSPWALPSRGAPDNDTKDFNEAPARTFSDARGGARFVFNVFDATFSLAHYYTYFDTETLQEFTRRTLLNAFDDGKPCPGADGAPNPANPHCGAPVHVFHTPPKVQVTGATTTFAVPQFYSVVRSEFAYFKDEAAFTQRQLDPFIFNLGAPSGERKQTGGRRQRDSVNAVAGLDTNQWIRFLNPDQTFFISTQFFYKHIIDAAGSDVYITVADKARPGQTKRIINPDREVLPLTRDQANFYLGGTNVGRLEPIFIGQPRDQYLHTFYITTSYRSGTINPAFTFFYDWGGALVFLPEIVFTKDPFRFAIDYSILDAHTLKGGSGVSLLKDRDNVQFRIEYVI